LCILKLLCVYVCYTINKDQSINQSCKVTAEKGLVKHQKLVVAIVTMIS